MGVVQRDEPFGDVLASNDHYAQRFVGPRTTGTAARGLAVVTCMDSRISPLEMLGLRPGDAKILRNAGARVTDDVLRTLVLAVHLLDVTRVLVVAHTDCRMASVTDDDIHSVMLACGVDTRSLEFRTVRDQAETLWRDVQRIRSSPYLPPGLPVAGRVYDVTTGRLAVEGPHQEPPRRTVEVPRHRGGPRCRTAPRRGSTVTVAATLEITEIIMSTPVPDGTGRPSGLPVTAFGSTGQPRGPQGPQHLLGEFPTYVGAEQLVDRLSDKGFPVEQVRIVGTGLRTVEYVTGRLTTARAALAGAASGAWFGVLVGLLLALFTTGPAMVGLLLGGAALGAVWGAAFGFFAHWSTRGRRDFASVKGLEAEQYAVYVTADRADEAIRLAGLF